MMKTTMLRTCPTKGRPTAATGGWLWQWPFSRSWCQKAVASPSESSSPSSSSTSTQRSPRLLGLAQCPPAAASSWDPSPVSWPTSTEWSSFVWLVVSPGHLGWVCQSWRPTFTSSYSRGEFCLELPPLSYHCPVCSLWACGLTLREVSLLVWAYRAAAGAPCSSLRWRLSSSPCLAGKWPSSVSYWSTCSSLLSQVR